MSSLEKREGLVSLCTKTCELLGLNAATHAGMSCLENATVLRSLHVDNRYSLGRVFWGETGHSLGVRQAMSSLRRMDLYGCCT